MRRHIALQNRDRRVGVADQGSHDRFVTDEILRWIDLRIGGAGSAEHGHGAVVPPRLADDAGDDDLSHPAAKRYLGGRREAVRLARQAPGAIDVEVGVGYGHEPELALGEAPAAREVSRPFPAPALRLPKLSDVICP